MIFPGSGGWLPETESEDEAGAQMIPLDEENYNGRRLNQYEGCEQMQGFREDSPHNSQFRVVFQHESPGHIPEQEGASSEDRDQGGGGTCIVGRTSLVKREC